MSRLLTLRSMTRRSVVTEPVLRSGALPQPPRASAAPSSTPGAAPVRNVRPARRLPPRDASGAVVGVVEVAVVTTTDQRERFLSLSVALHRRWFLERPSPVTAQTLPTPVISAAS